jgi:antitoxin ParD1/3/4
MIRSAAKEVLVQAAEKLSITLPADMVQSIRAKVRDGSYASDSEVIRQAVRGWLDQADGLATLDAAIERGIADADAGRMQESGEVQRELLARLGLEDR